MSLAVFYQKPFYNVFITAVVVHVICLRYSFISVQCTLHDLSRLTIIIPFLQFFKILV